MTFGEEARALAEDQRVHVENIFVDEARGKQSMHQLGAALCDESRTVFLFQLRDGTIIDAGTRGNSARWINHSCQPNCESLEYDDGTLFIHARRTIRAGEELCYDYRIGALGKVTDLDREDYACACKSPRCRGTLLLTPKRRGRKGSRTK